MVTTKKAHRPRPIQAVSLIPATRTDLIRLHEEMERDRAGLAKRFAEEIGTLEQEVIGLDREIEQISRKIEATNTMRAQMLRQGCTETAQQLAISMRQDNRGLNALQARKTETEKQIRELEGRRDGLGLT